MEFELEQEPTLITEMAQGLPNFDEERPETEDFDGLVEYMTHELQGRKVLDKPRVSKKIMVYALQKQTTLIKSLKRDASR
jgi:hypothetical protein